MELANRQRLSSLTGARFFAAVAVLSFHLMALITGPKALELVCSYGRAGVCFFFVLSGFVLAYNYNDRFTRLTFRGYGRYLWARVARIGPTHILTLLLITPLCLWLNSRGALLAVAHGPVVGARVATESWFANLFLVQVYLPKLPFEQLYNAPAWSIACEAVFYLAFPFFIARLSQINGSWKRWIAISAIFWLLETAVVMIALFVIRSKLGKHHEERPFDFYIVRMPFVRFGEFAVGCCTGMLFLKTRSDRAAPSGNTLLLVALGIAALTLAVFGCFPFFSYTSYSVAVVPTFAVLIFALASAPTWLTWLLDHPAIVLLGEASYALYLLHWTAYLWIRHQYGVEAPGWYLLTAAVVCVAASVVFLIGVDVPIRRYLRGRPAAVDALAANA